MLILTRQTDERILIGDDIVIEIREVRGKQVRIGVEAPPCVRILREELVEPPAAASTEREHRIWERPKMRDEDQQRRRHMTAGYGKKRNSRL